MFFGTTVQTGYAFWAGLAEVFVPGALPGLLLGDFILAQPYLPPPALPSIFGHMISVPLLYHKTNNRFTTETTS